MGAKWGQSGGSEWLTEVLHMILKVFIEIAALGAIWRSVLNSAVPWEIEREKSSCVPAFRYRWEIVLNTYILLIRQA